MNPQLRKLALDLGPLILFFAAFQFAGIFAATGIFIVAVLISLAVGWHLEKKLSPIPVVTAILRTGMAELTLANEGQQEVTYTLTPNDFKGHTQTVAVKGGKSKTIGWPTDQDGYYDVVITATSAGGFRRRYAGRIA